MGQYGVTDEYKKKLTEAEEYQDFIIDQLRIQLGVFVYPYSSRKYQYDVGESPQGIEIKYDRLMHKTGNIYIETEEKTHPAQTAFTPSGILRNDNTWLYLIGDRTEAFIFSKIQLKQVYKDKKRWKFYGVEEAGNDTSNGFLIKKSKLYNSETTLVLKHLIFKED